MQFTKNEYDNLNHFGVVHIFIVIRLFLGVFAALGTISMLNTYYLNPGYESLPTVYGLACVLMVACIIVFFVKHPAFLYLYIGLVILLVCMNFWVANPASAGASILIEGAFILYLLLSKRTAVVFKTKDVYVEVDPAPQIATALSAPAPKPVPVPANAPTPEAAPVPMNENRVLNNEQVKNIVLDLVKMPQDYALLRIGGMQLPAIDKKIIYDSYKKVSQKIYPNEGL